MIGQGQALIHSFDLIIESAQYTKLTAKRPASQSQYQQI
jgi:hypothetical protein